MEKKERKGIEKLFEGGKGKERRDSIGNVEDMLKKMRGEVELDEERGSTEGKEEWQKRKRWELEKKLIKEIRGEYNNQKRKREKEREEIRKDMKEMKNRIEILERSRMQELRCIGTEGEGEQKGGEGKDLMDRIKRMENNL
ncbi:hypothetical protein ALC57_13068 [Trachymyrmex cornetzi]|uniref:Uncharacterized protein n=1 Tax=Trachymyrmex cornetzi TaxID=471704 RepID=A0A151J027_9HYME|nr:hypothetical protein ALC57_13068 [Trachymyrmex cornetzi]